MWLTSAPVETLLCEVSEEYKDRIEILTKDLKLDEGTEVYKQFYAFIDKPNPKVRKVTIRDNPFFRSDISLKMSARASQ